MTEGRTSVLSRGASLAGALGLAISSLAIAVPVPARAASPSIPTFVQASASTTKVKFGFNNPVAAGDLLVAGITTNDGGTDPITGVSDSLNGSWTKVASVKYGNGHVELYYRANSAAGIDTVTFSGSQSAFTLAEYSGVLASTAALDQFASRSGTGSPAAGPTTTIAGAGELVVGVGGNPAPSSSSTVLAAGTGFTLRSQADAPWSYANGLEDALSSSSAGQSMAMRSAVSSYYGAVVAVFKAPTAGTPKAALTMSPASGAAPLTVTADASASTDPLGITSYTFAFGDGSVAGPQGAPTATHTYATGGTFTAQVTVGDSTGATATTTATVKVGAPVAALAVTPGTGATPLPVTANASASTDPIGIASYTFNFGDGSAAVGPQAGATASHTYSVAGTYAVTVTVQDSAGASAVANASVTAAAPPVASLTVTPASGAAPLAVSADASASIPGSNPIASYTFNFGDGSAPVAPQVSPTAGHTYSAGGHFTIAVTVTDSARNTASTTRTVTVGLPGAQLVVTPVNGTPLTVTADAGASVDPIGIISYTFNFGDGSAPAGPQAGSSAVHTYAVGGSYTVTVTITDTIGVSASASATALAGAPVAALTVTPPSGRAPLQVNASASGSTDPVAIVNYAFDFGDGAIVSTGTTPQAAHTYTATGHFTARLTVTDAAGATATTTQSVTVGLPSAALVVSPSTGGTPLTVAADASGSTDPIGLTTYTFNFGDGTVVGPQSGATAGHTYSSVGTYTVVLTVADSAGATSSANSVVIVASPPIAALTVTPASGPAPLSVTANASASAPGTNPIVSYKFDFGDGTVVGPQAGSTASHVFTAGGHYAVVVTVSDGIGVSATATQTVTANAPPTANLTVTPSSGTTPLSVTANASASVAGSNPISSYTFQYGDGTTVGPQPSATSTHTYAGAGTFTVSVTVTDSAGASASASASVTASVPPVAALALSTHSGAAPLPVSADASSSVAGTNSITAYSFDFGDGTRVGPQTGAIASHTYTAGGTYIVTVMVTDSAGYSSSANQPLTVGAPVAKLNASPVFGPAPLQVTADASASTDPIGIASYKFAFGDGTVLGPQAGATAAHTYATAGNYTLTVTVTDITGATSSASSQITAVVPPSAALVVSPTLAAIPSSVTADASGSTAGTNPIASYAFDFGDGTGAGPQAGATATHIYTTAGRYTVTVTVTDSRGVTSNATGVTTAVTPPTAHVTATPRSGGVPLSVTADGSSSVVGTNPIATYTFSFGDGTVVGPQSGSIASHTYTTTGGYTVTLVVTDSAGISSSATASVTVVNPPTAVLSASPGTGVAPIVVTADASGSSDALGIASYTFNFGDGSAVVGPQVGAQAAHTYVTAGNYTVTVTVTDTAQSSSIATAAVAVLAPPTARLTATPISGYAPLSVIADASASAAGTYPIAGYTFNFGDGTAVVGPQTNPSTSHVYLNPGSFTATVTVTDSQGNSSSATAPVTVTSGVLAQDTFSRANQSGGWGTASSGVPWGPGSSSLSISANEGVVTATASSLYETLGTATTADANGLVRFSVASSTDTAGIILREQSNGNMYLGRYDGAGHLQFEYRIGTTWTHVSLVAFTPTINTFYWLRFQLQGTNVNLKAWQYGTTEPAAWNWSGTSSGITAAGQMGLYSYAGAGTPVSFDTFSVVAVGNPVPNSTISGVVTNSANGAPVAGVVISTLPVTTTATTTSLGTYSLNLPAGTFTVVFTAYGVGFNSNYLSGVQAPVNGAVSANQQLTAIPAQTAMDTFTQPNQSNGFGISTDGNVWSNDFASFPGAQAGITNGQAWVDTQSSSQTDLDTWMGYQYQNQQVTIDLNMTTILVDPVFQHGARVLARVQNSTTWLLMTIDPTGQDLTLWATLNNNWTQLAFVSQPVSINTWYHTKLDVIGNLVEGKVWAFGTTEPGWQISATQQIVNGAGQGGLRTTGAYVQYANFQQAPITQVSGIVTKAGAGTPIANATITLNTGVSTTSDSSGSYTLAGLAGGTAYTVTVTAAGYQPSSFQVTPQSGTTVAGNVSLSP